MHWSGKLFAVLVVLAAVVAVWLTAELIEDRNSWARKAATFETEHATNQAKLQESRRQAEQLRTELETTLREWGGALGTWITNTSVTSPAEGKLSVDLGTNQRIKDSQVLHGFELSPDGKSAYRGAFIVTTAQADRSALQPTWRVRPEDAATWRPGQWRWRSLVPSAYAQHADEQALSFAEIDETLNDRAATLQIQNQLIAEAQQQLKERKAELLGGEELAQDEVLGPEFRQGLSITLSSLEEERNKLLLENDDLRRRVRTARDAVLRLQQQNEQLVQKLPQPAPEVSKRD
jgi:hypothetical protein